MLCGSPGTDSARRYSELARRHRQIYTRQYHIPQTRCFSLHSIFTYMYVDPTQLQFALVLYSLSTGDDYDGTTIGAERCPTFTPTNLTPPFPKLGGYFISLVVQLTPGCNLLSPRVSFSSCGDHM